MKKPIVDETDGDKIIAKEVSQCVFTCDHRFGDASSMNTALKVMRDFVEAPEDFDPTLYKDSGEKWDQIYTEKKKDMFEMKCEDLIKNYVSTCGK